MGQQTHFITHTHLRAGVGMTDKIAMPVAENSWQRMKKSMIVLRNQCSDYRSYIVSVIRASVQVKRGQITKRFTTIWFALLCVTIALLCVTFHSAENRRTRIHCYKCGDSEPQESAPAHDKDVRQCRNNIPRPPGPARSAMNYPADSIFSSVIAGLFPLSYFSIL